MLNGKKLKLILAFISLIFCITTVQQTYAKYVTSTTAGANMTIARGRILVNTEDVHTGTYMQNNIIPTFNATQYIKENVVAPTSEGYFDIVLDSSNTDLSFTYSITTSVATTSSVTDLVIQGYSLNGGDITTFSGTNRTITGNVLYNSGVTTNTIRIYIKWDDSADATMNNTADTNASYDTEHQPAVNVNLSFIQMN